MTILFFFAVIFVVAFLGLWVLPSKKQSKKITIQPEQITPKSIPYEHTQIHHEKITIQPEQITPKSIPYEHTQIHHVKNGITLQTASGHTLEMTDNHFIGKNPITQQTPWPWPILHSGTGISTKDSSFIDLSPKKIDPIEAPAVNKENKPKIMSISLSQDMYNQVRREAKTKNTSTSVIVRDMINGYFSKDTKSYKGMLVFYVDVGDIASSATGAFLERFKERVCLAYNEDLLYYWIPVRNQDTKIVILPFPNNLVLPSVKEPSVVVSGPSEGNKVIKWPDGSIFWYNKDSRLHNDEGPAVVLANGGQMYYQNGQKHRVDGPAEITENTKKYYTYGKLHRIDGPAIILKVAHTDLPGERTIQSWYLNGEHFGDGAISPPAYVKKTMALFASSRDGSLKC